MGTLTKTFVILNLVFSVAFVMITATVLAQRTHWKGQYYDSERRFKDEQGIWNTKQINFQSAIDLLSRERDGAKAREDSKTIELAQKEKTLKERDESIEKLGKDITDANARADRLTQSVTLFTQNLTTAQGERDKLKGELAAAQRDLDARAAMVVALRADKAALEVQMKDQLNKLNVATAQMATDVKWKAMVRKENSTLASAVDRALGEGVEIPGEKIRAAVKAVNMESGLVVLNVGADSMPPVKKGYKFLIHRGREFIAAVQVINVEKNMCATEIVPPQPDNKVAVQVGDEAVTEF